MAPTGTPLIYIANIRLPSERAHVLQIVKTCEALSRQKLAVELWYPRRRRQALPKDPWKFYGVRDPFSLCEIACPDIYITRRFAALYALLFRLHSVLFARAAKRELERRGSEEGLVYTRDLFVATALARAARPFVYELHTLLTSGRGRAWTRYVLPRASGVVTINRLLASDAEELGVSRQRILVAPDGVEASATSEHVSKSEARAELGLGSKALVAAYTGQFFDWKGVDTVVRAAGITNDWTFVLVGGADGDIARLRRAASELPKERVRIEGFQEPTRIPTYLAAADVLLVPNLAGSRISERDTSPLKAFEYMAAGRPIVASDLPSLREIFSDEETAILVPPGDERALVAALDRLAREPGLGERLANAAQKRAKWFSWDQRAGKIAGFLRRLREQA
jgi:glycosyltransferase involved in cell wall biosynthesis